MSEYLRPTTLEEALRARADHGEYMVLAGGTDLYVGAPAKEAPAGILDVFGLGAIRGIRKDGDELVVGSATTYSELITSKELAKHLPILPEAAREVGALQIQARGTIGGNVVTSSPVGDTLPVLLASDARVNLASVRGERQLPYEEFITGYRETALADDELLVSLVIPAQPEGAQMGWRKVGTRRAQSISKVMMAGVAALEDGAISHLRLALGAVADRTVRVKTAEALAIGKEPSPALADEVRRAVENEIRPISDVRSTADYRLETAANIVARFVADLA